MAGIKISALPAIPSCQATDLIAEVQPSAGGTTYKATLSQVITLINASAAFVPLVGGTITGPIINYTNTPSQTLELVSKGYVDSVASGFNIVAACRLGSTIALTVVYNNGASGVGATLTNAGVQAALSLDGVAAVVNDRVLIKNQASALQNGIYIVTDIGSGATNWVLTRASDFDTPAEIQPGDLVIITAGSTLSNSSWVETATVTTVGTDPINFSQFSASLPISLANGGTGASLVAVNGGIFYSNATTGAISAAGLAGQLFQSAGAAPPVWTTATYPATATNAARILRADGTNWVQTTSTFADTYGASSILYANGANNVAGLATVNNGTLTTNGSGVPTWLTQVAITQVNIQRITATGAGTYTPTTGMRYVIVRAQAGGGGGGGAATATAIEAGAGGGGGGGEYIEALFTAAQVGVSLPYSVGISGAGGVAGNNTGSTGGNTTFNTTFIITVGGSGGTGGPATSTGAAVASSFGGIGGTGGSVATGVAIRQLPGAQGGVSLILINAGIPGYGGNSGSGAGGANIIAVPSAGLNAAANSGAGGSGANTINSSQVAGGDGGQGFLEFIEYISV